MAPSEVDRAAIDSGRSGEKVPMPDPSSTPLGTDDEAAGTRPQTGSPQPARPSGSAATRETEPSPGRPSAVTHEAARPASGLDPKARSANRMLLIVAFAVLAVFALVLVLVGR